ncbi:hypothetical protein C5167_044758 [Papaver somniferum]|nr:hypothetical protein C5167_044758 [Papaver somniferum]
MRINGIHGKDGLVTGATKGIGHAIVEELAAFGAVVHITARNEKGYKVTGSVSDASIQADREMLIKTVSSVFDGKLNILVNNVGTAVMKETMDYTNEDHAKVMATNFDSGYRLSVLAHPLLKASGTGSIVFISSVASVVAVPQLSNYSAAKGIDYF